ncbi:hypothetical protein GE09DRAFT_675098 [Coniochaeta sp. 2T2.1]|nr:hypothetical protein GE09DRAFT_675098 [Coniochaeta sp. 2T2.1]
MGVTSPTSTSRTSSPVAVGSPTDSQASGKRKRASKPKVRTGCITCKIRRVKCGEEKPACVRCTSTGRTCDGYDKGVPPRNRTLEFQRNAETAKMEFIKAYQWNEALRSMRPIAADIDGTDSEKKFFRRFRLLATDGLTNHVCNFTQFWNRVTPHISHQDEAVKHAVIALGAAYQIFQLNDQEQNHEKTTGKVLHTGTADEFTHENLEVFTIQQYNKSICKLQRHVGSSSPESIQVTLICCLAFICLETMRGHHEAAVTHLINGLNILQSIPTKDFDFLADLSGDNAQGGPRGYPYSTVCDMQDIIDLFGRLEVSACFFASGLRPIVAERGYALRKYDDATSENYPSEYYSPRQAHRPYTYFLRDVLARLYETSQEPPGSPFWSDPRQQKQQNCLSLRAARLDALIRQFLNGPYAPPPDTDDHYCIYLDLLHFRAAQILLAGMDERLTGHGSGCGIGYVSHLDYPSSPTGSSASSSSYSGGTTPRSFSTSPLPPDHAALSALAQQPDAQWLQSDLLNIASLLNASHTAKSMRHTSKQRIFFNDAGTVGPAYLVAVTATDPAIRSRAFRLLAETGSLGVGDCSGFFWDGPGLRERLGFMVDPSLVGGMAWQTGMGGMGVNGMGGAPLVQDALDRLQSLRVER